MSNYENGSSTRRLILNACIKLFLDKGFHETTYDDICREAHVNRGSIYYHFKEKENIRYEVFWEITLQNKKFVAQYCEREDLHFLLATYILWYQLLHDSRIKSFLKDYFADYPIYSGQHSLARYYDTLDNSLYSMYSKNWVAKKAQPLARASRYGYIMSMLQLGGTHPEHYTSLELFRCTFVYSNTILGIPGEDIERLWGELLPYIEKLPLDILPI